MEPTFPHPRANPTGSNSARLSSSRGGKHVYRHANNPSGFTLGPIDLTLRPEEIAFLVGATAARGTTLVKLITFLYASEEGRSELDGRTTRADDLEDYRQLFTAALADGHLFKTLLGSSCGPTASTTVLLQEPRPGSKGIEHARV